MKNMESDKKHQEAIRASNQRLQLSVEPTTHSQAKPPCVDIAAASQASIRVRLPNGSQNIIKMHPESTVSYTILHLLVLCKLVHIVTYSSVAILTQSGCDLILSTNMYIIV